MSILYFLLFVALWGIFGYYFMVVLVALTESLFEDNKSRVADHTSMFICLGFFWPLMPFVFAFAFLVENAGKIRWDFKGQAVYDFVYTLTRINRSVDDSKGE